MQDRSYFMQDRMVLQYDQEKGEATTSTAYEDITSTEDASFAEQPNTTCAKQEHAVDLSLICLSYFHEDLQSDPYEVP